MTEQMSNQNPQREYWARNLDTKNLGDNSALSRFNFDEELEFYFSPEQEYALKKLWGENGLRGKRILEIGCGLGVFALFLARQEAQVYVVDIAQKRLEFLKAQAERLGVANRINIICGAAEELPFRENSFDAVYTKSALIHTNLNRASSESARILKAGGVGVFVEPMKYNPLAWIYRRFFAPGEWKSITTYFDRGRLRMLPQSFGRVRVRYFYLLSFAAFFWQFAFRSVRQFKFWLRFLGALDGALFKFCPLLRRLSWFAVVCVEKKIIRYADIDIKP